MDPTCGRIADEMSCDAQIQLAKREVQNNTYMTNYRTSGYPACERMNTLMDRGAESAMWLSMSSGKKMCFTWPTEVPRDTNGQGPWVRQFHDLLGEPSQESFSPIPFVEYDKWTRARNRTTRGPGEVFECKKQ